MRILLAHNRYVHEGGEEEAVESLADLLKSRGHDIHRYEPSSRDWLNHSGVEKARDAMRILYSQESANALASVIGHFKPDLLHVHNLFPVLSPSILYTAQRLKTPVVQTLHNYRWLCANGLFLTPAGQICERCKGGNFTSAIRFGCYNGRWRSIPMAASLAFHRARRTPQNCIDRFIAPSRFLRDKYIEAGWPEDRLDVIPNPVRLPKPQSTPRSLEPVFVYAGRLSREKGILTLLKAFKEGAPGRLVILGDGPLYPACKQLESARITVAGRVSHDIVFETLARAWALIMPSECYENLPQAILESWVSGTPVVASRLGGLAELVQEGETGWTFEPGNAADLIGTLRDLEAHPEKAHLLSEKCRAAAQKFYNNENIYPNLMTVYDHAIRRCAGNS